MKQKYFYINCLISLTLLSIVLVWNFKRKFQPLKVAAIGGLLVIVCFNITGCGYTTSMLRGERIRYMHVTTFLNKTYESGLDRLVTDAVADEFIFKGSVKISNAEKADVEVNGVIKEYLLKPISYNSRNEAEQYRLRITVDVSIKERSTERIIWEAKDLSGEWTFLRSGPLRSSEEKARDKAIKYLAREIVQNAAEMW